MKQLLASPSLQLVTYPASATAQSAEFASADCVTGLNEIGQISVSNISGDPQDVERIVALKADEQGASWYRIITMYEDQQPDILFVWYDMKKSLAQVSAGGISS